ncbi:MAG TPA: M48 family metallopeptidase [Tepidisphaeraceae bacterium]|nr:M48 family metallopeptidase [Tepidisphaeraceae bacterium]
MKCSSAAFACTLLLLLVGCQAPAPAAKFIEQADRMHSGALASTVVVNTDLDDYVQQVADRVVAAAKLAAPGRVNVAFIDKVRCHLVSSNTINAFSTGGTHVYVTTGLFQQCQNEEELAGAIAHAYAHLIDLDLEATKMNPNPGEPLTMVAWDFVTNRYTLTQERRADALALSIFAQAGYDPDHFANLFERMESITGGNVAPDRESLPARAANLQAAAAAVKRTPHVFPVADPKTFVSLRDQAAAYHEPTTLTVPLIFLRAFPNCVLSADTMEQKEAQERLKPVAPPPRAPVEPN